MKNPEFSGQASGPSRFRRLGPDLKASALRHPLLAGLVPVSAGYRQGPDWSIGFDVQRSGGELLLQYCEEGQGEFEAGGVVHPVGPGDLMVLASRVDHAYRTSPERPWKVWWVYFDGLEAEKWAKFLLEAGDARSGTELQGSGTELAGAGPEPEAATGTELQGRGTEPEVPSPPGTGLQAQRGKRDVPGTDLQGRGPGLTVPGLPGSPRPAAGVVHLGHDPFLEACFLDLCSVMETAWTLSGLLLAAAGLRTLLAQCHLRLQTPRGSSRTRRDLEVLVDWMRGHLDAPMELEALAARYGTCRDQLIRDFKAVYQYTPMDYFLRLRLQKAAELMVTRGLLVSQAALALGFQDPFYFSRIFTKKMGLSPRRWLETQG